MMVETETKSTESIRLIFSNVERQAGLRNQLTGKFIPVQDEISVITPKEQPIQAVNRRK